MSLEELLARLRGKVQTIRSARPLPPEALRSLRDWLRVETTYTSNAIEGNSLTRQETTVVLEGMTIGGKSLRDHLEALDHAEAFDYMYELSFRDAPFTEVDLRSLHRLVLLRSRPHQAGKYRDVQVWIRGSQHVPPPPVDVGPQMAQLFRDLPQLGGEEPIQRAALFHERLVSIHPFVDGNGRTARLASNVLLLREGFPIAIIQPEPEARTAYFNALEACRQGDTEPIVRIFAVASERTADFLLRGLVPRQWPDGTE